VKQIAQGYLSLIASPRVLLAANHKYRWALRQKRQSVV